MHKNNQFTFFSSKTSSHRVEVENNPPHIENIVYVINKEDFVAGCCSLIFSNLMPHSLSFKVSISMRK